MQKSHYPALFIVSIAVGAVLGTWGNLDERFNRLVDRHSQSQLGRGLSTGILLYCIGALSIVGPVMAAVKHDPTMLFTNATLDLISSVILGASFGAGMMLAAPKLAGGDCTWWLSTCRRAFLVLASLPRFQSSAVS